MPVHFAWHVASHLPEHVPLHCPAHLPAASLAAHWPEQSPLQTPSHVPPHVPLHVPESFPGSQFATMLPGSTCPLHSPEQLAYASALTLQAGGVNVALMFAFAPAFRMASIFAATATHFVSVVSPS